MKAYIKCPQLTSYWTLKNWKCLLLKSRARQGYPLLPLLFNTIMDVLARIIMEHIQIIKEEVKQSVFIDSMILYRENPKDSTQKTLWINQTNKSNHMNPGMLQKTKINIQNQICSHRLITSYPKRKLRKWISLTLASKNNILRRLETGCQSRRTRVCLLSWKHPNHT